MTRVILSWMLSLLVGISAYTQTKTIEKMTKAELTHAINKAVQTGDVQAVSSLVKYDYIQHTPVVPDGRKGLEILVRKIRDKELPTPQITNVRTLVDGDFVILHHEVKWPSRKTMIEIYRVEGDLAAEHWSGIMDHPEVTVNGHTMTDGSTVLEDLDKTNVNKKFAKEFVETVLIAGQFDKILDYYHPEIIQHNPYIDNSVSGLLKGIEDLKANGIALQIQKVWKVFGEGNFVLVCSEGLFGGKHTAFFDLFRVEKGKIVEHWDVLQEIPSPQNSANKNGFFEQSLYKRIGGYDAIAGFVDLAFPRVAAHPRLEKYFVGHAMDSKYRQRQLIVDKLSSTLEGPTVYLGRPLDQVHKGLNITAEEWDIFMNILTQAMDERGIGGKEKEDFIFIFQNVFHQMTIESDLK